MQDNQLHGNLTVEEAMTVATSLKLSTKVPKGEKIVVVSNSFFPRNIFLNLLVYTSNLNANNIKQKTKIFKIFTVFK